MNFENFTDMLEVSVTRKLNSRIPGCGISRKMIRKLQEGSYLAITVNPPGGNIGVNLNVTDLYDYYVEKPEIEEIAEESVQTIIRQFELIPVIDMNLMTDYEVAKKHLIIQVVAVESNRDMLASIPHRIIEDLAIVYRLKINADHGRETCLINHDLLENYGVTEKQLHEDAMGNSARINPILVRDLYSIMNELIEEEGLPVTEIEQRGEPLFFVGNQERLLGAAAIFYPGVMDMCASIIGGSYYILPSSIHEMLITPALGACDEKMLAGMIREINSTVVPAAERLTDHAYYYDAARKKFSAV